MKRFTTGLLTVALCTFTLAMSGAAWAENPDDILVVTNKASPLGELSLRVVQQIFLKKRGEVDGHGVSVFVATSESPLRDAFAKAVLKMTPQQEAEYWANELIQNGRSEPPSTLTPLRAVSSLPSAISYVFRKNYKDGLAKIVATCPR